MNDKQWTVAAFRLSVRLSDMRRGPALCLPRKEPARANAAAEDDAPGRGVRASLLFRSSEASLVAEGNGVSDRSEPPFAPNLTRLSNDTEVSDNAADR